MRYFFLTYTKYACEKLPFFDEKSQAESSPPICSVLPWGRMPEKWVTIHRNFTLPVKIAL